MVLGMIPDCDLRKVSSAGNAAGTGARIALLDHALAPTIEALVRRVEKIETAIEPRFQAALRRGDGDPALTAPYPHLSRVVKLPEPKPPPARASTRTGRRRPPS